MARDAELRARITAKDDASKVIDKVAAAARDLEDHPVEVEVDADVANVLSALDQVSAEAKQTAEAAEALGRALGPELAAKADTTAIVGDLRNMGLSIDQIKGNADELAAKMRELSDADVGGGLGKSLGTTRGQLDDLGKSADSSKSVLANMVGNSAQDVAELGGVAGSAGVAIGQMGEYMADAAAAGDSFGQIVKNFGKIAAPLAAITVVVSSIGSIFKAAGERAARAKEQVQAFTGSLSDVDEATGAVEGLAESMTAFDADARTAWGGFVEGVAGAAKSLPLIGGMIGDAGQNISNVIPVFNKLNITARDIGEAAAKGGSAWDSLQSKLYAAQVGAHITSAEYSAASQALYGFRDSAEAAGVMSEFLAGGTEDTAAAAERSAKATEWTTEAMDGLAGISEKVAELLLAQADALNAQVDAATSAADQQLDVNDLMVRYGELLGDNEASIADVRDAAIDLAKADAELKDTQAEANGVMLTATTRLDNQNDALLNTAAAAKGPARTAILDYIASVNQIPPEKMTEIQAAVDAGDLVTANRLLNEASAPRKAAVTADANTAAAENELNSTARTRDSTIRANVVKGSGWNVFQTGPFAAGGATATPGTVGVAAQATVVPITFKIPSGAEIAKRIGAVRLPFVVSASLRADERLSGIRD